MAHKHIEQFEVDPESRLHEVLMVYFRSLVMYENSVRKKTKGRYNKLGDSAIERAHSIVRKYVIDSELPWNSWTITIGHGATHSDVTLRRGSVRFYVTKKD